MHLGSFHFSSPGTCADSAEYSRAVTPQVRQTGNRLPDLRKHHALLYLLIILIQSINKAFSHKLTAFQIQVQVVD